MEDERTLLWATMRTVGTDEQALAWFRRKARHRRVVTGSYVFGTAGRRSKYEAIVRSTIRTRP